MADSPRTFDGPWHRAGTRVMVLFAILVAVTTLTGATWSWLLAPAIGWIAAAGSYSIWVWLVVLRLDAAETAAHARREDPTEPVAHALLILASIASFGAIALLLVDAGFSQGAATVALAAAAVVTVAASWFLIHILFTLRYAAIYFAEGASGIEFNQPGPPRYSDFAYVAFTLGMTYQVSDTNITHSAIRREVLRHALLSFLLGVVVLAAAINLVVSLAR